MNRRQLLLVWFAVALVGCAGWVVFDHQQQAWAGREPRMGDKVLPGFNPNDVAAICLKGRSELNAIRQDGVWRVRERGGYPANYALVRDLLLKVKDLKVVQSEQVGPSQLGRVELEAPGDGPGCGTRLEFRDSQSNLLTALVVGKRHLRPRDPSRPVGLNGLFDGRYVLVPSESGYVLLAADELAAAVPEPEAWLSKDFFKIERPKEISLLSTNGTSVWTLGRELESSPWTLTDAGPGEILDTKLVQQTQELLGFLSFLDVIRAEPLPSSIAEVAKIVNNTPTRSSPSSPFSPSASRGKPMLLRVETFERFFYTLKIWPNAVGSNYLLQVVVNADLPALPQSGLTESPHASDNHEQQSQEHPDQLQAKLVREQALAKWVYAVEAHFIEPLILPRAQLLQLKEDPNRL